MKILIRLSLALASIILMLGLTEIALRIYDLFSIPSQVVCYESTKIPGLPYLAKANFHKRGYQTNSHHLRNSELPVAKPTGTIRVAVVGNSMTIGHSIAQEHLFTEIMGRDLLQRYGGHPPVEVINAGQMGYSICHFQPFCQYIIYSYQPDLILYQFCWNDDEITTTGRAPHIPDQPVNNALMRFLFKFRLFAHAAKMRNMQSFVENTIANWNDPNIRQGFYNDLLTWAQDVREHNARFVMVLFPLGIEVQALEKYPHIVANIERVKAEIIVWCRQNNIEAYDISGTLQEEYRKNHKNLFLDQGHFNNAGHLCVARALEQLPIYNFDTLLKN